MSIVNVRKKQLPMYFNAVHSACTDMKANQNQFGEWLRAWRKELGLTQGEVAEAVGKTKQHISNLERQQAHYASGGFAKPSIELVDGLAKLFGRPISEARDVAGYGIKENAGELPRSIEDALRLARFFQVRGLTEREIETIRPILEALDRQIEMITSVQPGDELEPIGKGSPNEGN